MASPLPYPKPLAENVMSTPSKSGKPSSKARWILFNPRLEKLEDRLQPSTLDTFSLGGRAANLAPDMTTDVAGWDLVWDPAHSLGQQPARRERPWETGDNVSPSARATDFGTAAAAGALRSPADGAASVGVGSTD